MKTFEIFPVKGGVSAPIGFHADGISAGLKGIDPLSKKPRLDIGFIYMEKPCFVEAIFTSNTFQAAPIKHFKKFVEGKMSNFILINAKNANSLTGSLGIDDIVEILEALQMRFPKIQNPIMSSTGVIGVKLPKDKIIESFHQINLTPNDLDSHIKAAQAIMTTDSFYKEISLKVELDNGHVFHIGAMAKGAGMIAPSMATMLCFITTDACVPQKDLKAILQECAHTTFNAISVDGDTSTNDTIMLFANHASGAYEESAFKATLKMLMLKLATDIVRDGEGANKLVAFEVNEAQDERQAIIAAKALSNSLLVKTAIFGCDPNWGRIASTIGACGVSTNEESLSISIGDILVYHQGKVLFDEEIEKKAAAVMKKDSFSIVCTLGMGNAKFRSYGCDLGYKYVEINSDYRS